MSLYLFVCVCVRVCARRLPIDGCEWNGIVELDRSVFNMPVVLPGLPSALNPLLNVWCEILRLSNYSHV